MTDQITTVEQLLQAIEAMVSERERRLDEEIAQVRDSYFWSLERAKAQTLGLSNKGDRRNRQMEPKLIRSARSRLSSVSWRRVQFRGKGVLPTSSYIAKGVKPMYSIKRLVNACNSWEREAVLQAEKLFAQIRAEASSLAVFRQEVRNLRSTLERQDKEIEDEFGRWKSRGISQV